MIKEEFINSLDHYAKDDPRIRGLWDEVVKNYNNSKRHYHNLAHIENLLRELLPFKTSFESWDAVVFTIVYHDIVYNTLKANNEEKSAHLAEKRLNMFHIPQHVINRCKSFILATKKHQTADIETNLITDADLSILGAESDRYIQYSQQIRKEYSIYPDILYYAGRKKVLLHFLLMDKIFKTDSFYSSYEASARNNLQNELSELKA